MNLRVRKAAEYCGLSKSLFDKMRGRGEGPAFIRIGTAVVYSTDDLDTWLSARRVPANDNAEQAGRAA